MRVEHGSCIDAHLVGSGVEQISHIAYRAYPPANGERNENLGGNLFDHAQNQAAPVGARGDIEEAQLIGTLLVVAMCDLHRIAGIAQADEIDALYHAPAGHIETGDDALGEAHD